MKIINWFRWQWAWFRILWKAFNVWGVDIIEGGPQGAADKIAAHPVLCHEWERIKKFR